MAFVPMASRQHNAEMFQKGRMQPLFIESAISRPLSEASEMDDTEFEEDMSDFDDYAGRRSEESFGKRSDTTISTFEELRTPASNDFKGFNFQLQIEDQSRPAKPVEGPVGPHLFRYSQDSSPELGLLPDWSPIESPKRTDLHIRKKHATQRVVEEAPPRSVPLESYTPQQVAGWMKATGFEEPMIDRFRANDINGAILKELKHEDLKDVGVASFGQRHFLLNEIRKLRGVPSMPPTPNEACYSPISPAGHQAPVQERRPSPCSNPPSPESDRAKSPLIGRRRARRALRPDDVISPAESASIVAIEQLLPKPHHCKKGEHCSKWQKQQRQFARIAKEFPLEVEQIGEANASPSEITVRPTSEAVPSVVASSDLLGPGRLPTLRLDPDVLRVVQTRDPQENVRQFLSFQHLDEPTTPPYEMFPPLSPPSNTQAPHLNLSKLPKLTIPATEPHDVFSPIRTVIRQSRTPVTAMHIGNGDNGHEVFRLGSPASEMDVPVTAFPIGPIARDESQSVPPDMRFGSDPIPRSHSRTSNHPPFSPISRPQTTKPFQRSSSHASRPSFSPFSLHPRPLSPIDATGELTPTTATPLDHAGWMKKRKTKMLRHEWHENHFRLTGTQLAMHRDSKTLDALDCIDVDEYAVACSSLASQSKLNSAFKSLKLGASRKKDGASAAAGAGGAGAFSFQLVPAAERRGLFGAAGAAGAKTHHFAVKTRDERIDWMRELMLAKARRQKADGCEVNVNGNMI